MPNLLQERMVMMHQQELDGVSRQHAELSALLGQHRDTVSTSRC